jgi:uncharacterized protein YjbI with pentapeptide repeats
MLGAALRCLSVDLHTVVGVKSILPTTQADQQMKARTRLLVIAAVVLVATILVAPPALFAFVATDPEWAKFWAAAAQPYATVLVGMGAILAASLAFYNGERERRQRSEHESDKARREVKRELNERQSDLVAKLADTQPIIREGAAHGLVALADDWFSFGDDKQHRVCISMLATYLRTPMIDANPQHPDVPVRGTIIRLISELAQRNGVRHYWSELNLQGVDLRSVTLSPLNLENFWVDSAQLTGADLSRANFTSANLTGANLDDCDLTGTNFTSAMLQLASAKRTNLRRTNFTRGALFAIDLSDAFIIRHANGEPYRGHDFMSQAPIFTESYLMGAQLKNANLSGALLTKAKLGWANFTNATLFCADLTGADVTGTILAGTDLTRAILTDIQPDASVMLFDDDTQWPKGFVKPHGGLLPREDA